LGAAPQGDFAHDNVRRELLDRDTSKRSVLKARRRTQARVHFVTADKGQVPGCHRATGSALLARFDRLMGAHAVNDPGAQARYCDLTKPRTAAPFPFPLKTDPKGALQYGLIAEESPRCIRSSSSGLDGSDRRSALRQLAPMLLNEAQPAATEDSSSGREHCRSGRGNP